MVNDGDEMYDTYDHEPDSLPPTPSLPAAGKVSDNVRLKPRELFTFIPSVFSGEQLRILRAACSAIAFRMRVTSFPGSNFLCVRTTIITII